MTQTDIIESAVRKELGMVALTWQVLEDGGGNLYLAVLDGDDVIYYGDGYEHNPSALRDDVEALRAGANPVREAWDMPAWVYDQFDNDPGIDDLNAIYDDLRVGELGGCVLVADQDGVYYDRMGAAAQSVFQIP